jgi:hypothetical protein
MSENARRRAARTGSPEGISPPEQVRIVRRYLSTLDALRPGRGPKRAAESIANRLLKIDELLISADPVSRLHLTQERIDLDAEAIRLGNGNEADLGEMETEFVKVAKSYGDRVGITFSAWRQVGVEADVLERAGIVRIRKPQPPQQPQAAATAKPAKPAADPHPELELETPPQPAAPPPAPAPAPTKKAAAKKPPAAKKAAAAKKS